MPLFVAAPSGILETNMTRRFSAASLFFSLLFLPAVTHAQEGGDNRAQIRALVAQGEQEFDARAFLAASRTFARAREMMEQMSHPRAFMLLYNEARCAEELGHTAQAAELYQRWLDGGGTAEANAAEVQTRIRDLRERAGTSGGGISPVGPILIGVGGAAVIAGLIVGGLAFSADNDLSAECADPTMCDPALMDRQNEMRTMAMAADGLWIGGAVVAAVGVVLTIVLTEGGSETAASAGCDANGCGVTVAGRF